MEKNNDECNLSFCGEEENFDKAEEKENIKT